MLLALEISNLHNGEIWFYHLITSIRNSRISIFHTFTTFYPTPCGMFKKTPMSLMVLTWWPFPIQAIWWEHVILYPSYPELSSFLGFPDFLSGKTKVFSLWKNKVSTICTAVLPWYGMHMLPVRSTFLVIKFTHSSWGTIETRLYFSASESYVPISPEIMTWVGTI